MVVALLTIKEKHLCVLELCTQSFVTSLLTTNDVLKNLRGRLEFGYILVRLSSLCKSIDDFLKIQPVTVLQNDFFVNVFMTLLLSQ